MRAYGGSNSQWPSWLIALLIFGLLIGVVQLVGQPAPPQQSPLQQKFAATPAAGISLTLPTVPADLVALARTQTARLLGGETGEPLTRVAQNKVLRVRIVGLAPEGDQLHINGNIENISREPLTVSLDDFKFVDATNTLYAAEGSPSTTLEPGQQAPIDITLPIKDPETLRLDVELSNQPKIEMLLIGTVR